MCDCSPGSQEVFDMSQDRKVKPVPLVSGAGCLVELGLRGAV